MSKKPSVLDFKIHIDTVINDALVESMNQTISNWKAFAHIRDSREQAYEDLCVQLETIIAMLRQRLEAAND